MVKISKGDFIEVEYTGRTKEENFVFDTTDEAIAKEADIHSPDMNYGPVVICLGQKQLLPGLEKELEGKEFEEGKPGEYTIELQPEDGFGKKDAKLIKMIPFAAFKKQNIMPEPGMQVNIDGLMGIIKTAAGGRCLVDFNHPLSGREIVYTVKVNKIVTDDKEKIKSYVSLALNLKDIEVDIKEGKAEISAKKEIPGEIAENIKNKLKELVPSVKEISFKAEKQAPKPSE
ncbi:peptidylprolyl isomerase [Candidatus Woesearchaeota archaeon]|nr:peptidylprolyl isomerase [Candidatus Woesearchaeota archaeon]